MQIAAPRRRIERATSRGIIVGMSMSGRNPTEIAAHLGVSRCTVDGGTQTLRLQFAERYVDEGLDFWERVVFSNEKTSSTNHGKIQCWRKDNRRK